MSPGQLSINLLYGIVKELNSRSKPVGQIGEMFRFSQELG
jgi:hypothetical protein